jgi:hypothetical protein
MRLEFAFFADAASLRPDGTIRIQEDVAERICVQYLRALWMRKMGATQEDIDEYCDLVRHPGSVPEELENLRDLDELNLKNLPRADLEALSKKFSNPPTR